MTTVATLFEEPPGQWGLRGDPYLWRDMQEHFEGVPLPADAEELAQLLVQAFESLTGQPLASDAYFRVERYSHGGMSSGMVSPSWWKERGLPCLQERYRMA